MISSSFFFFFNYSIMISMFHLVCAINQTLWNPILSVLQMIGLLLLTETRTDQFNYSWLYNQISIILKDFYGIKPILLLQTIHLLNCLLKNRLKTPQKKKCIDPHAVFTSTTDSSTLAATQKVVDPHLWISTTTARKLGDGNLIVQFI